MFFRIGWSTGLEESDPFEKTNEVQKETVSRNEVQREGERERERTSRSVVDSHDLSTRNCESLSRYNKVGYQNAGTVEFLVEAGDG